MDDRISRIVAELGESELEVITRSTLLDLQSLLESDDPELIDRFHGAVSPSAILRPISAAMDLREARFAVWASDVYLSLLLSRNSPVFTLFTPLAFHSLLGSIQRYVKHRPRDEPGSAEARGANGPAQMGNKKRKGRESRNVRKNPRDESGDVSEEGSFEVKLLFRVLQKLGSLLGLVHLDRFPDSLKSLVQTVSDIPVIALELSGFVNFDRLVDLCGQILGELLRADHGDLAIAAGEISKSLTPLILMGKSQARSFALGFVSKRMMGLAKDSCEVKKAIVNLPKYLVHKAPEKAEARGLAVEAIMEMVKAMEYEDQMGFVEYVMKMAQGKANLRLLAVDLIPLLISSLSHPLQMSSDSETKHSWGLSCLDALIQRCSDSNALVRARALSNLALVVGFLSSDDRNKPVMKGALGFNNVDVLTGEMVINDLLRHRCVDEKAAVRKAALLLVTKLTSLLGGCFDDTVLKMMGFACSDPLVSIRKAAISALSEAFRTFSNENVTSEWLNSVPRLITDNESSIQEECERLFVELVLERISRAGSTPSLQSTSLHNNSNIESNNLERENEFLFPEGVLGLLKEICNSEVFPWVKKICASLGKKGRLKPKVALALQHVIKASESLWLSHNMPVDKWTAPPGAWFLLSEVSVYLSKAVDWEFLHHYWQLLDKNEVPGVEAQEDEVAVECNSVAWARDRVFLLQTISNVSKELPPEPSADFAHNLLKKIEEFNLHSAEVDAHVKALRTLCNKKASNPEESETLVKKWVDQVLSNASKIVEKYILEAKNSKHNSFSTPATIGSRKSKRLASRSKKLSKAVMAVYTVGSLVIVCPSADTAGIAPLLHTIITSGNSDPKMNDKLPQANVSLKQAAPPLYNQAWLTMGKICLSDGKLAKRYIPLFAQELEKSDCAALRNNLVVAMADFCVRYTAMVDCYITKITKCLCDPCELVRRQTFILLSRLLQRDYVKWRGVLFLRFLLSLVDESEKIRQLADFLFGNILKVKAPLLAYNSFVEAMYVLNDCQAHNGHNSDPKGSRSKNQAFSIRGNDERSRSKRMHIYITLLKQMAPEHLLATFAKLCAEVLAAASDGMLNIEDVTGQSVLQDAFQILACKEIRLSSMKGSSFEAAEVEEDGGGDAAAAKGRSITQAVRKGLIQNTIPIFIELKRLLESKNSPLTGSLMDCLRVLLKDYKNEIDEMLVADPQLQKELIYDMQKYEATKARSMAKEAISSRVSGFDRRKSNGNSVPNAASGSRNGNRVPGVVCGTSNWNASDAASRPKNGNILGVSCEAGRARVSGVDSKVAEAVADAAATMVAKSVLKEVNRGIATPLLSSMSVPKLKSSQEEGRGGQSGRPPVDVLESLRRRQSFASDDETSDTHGDETL